MIEPPPESSIAGMPYWHPRNTPLRLMPYDPVPGGLRRIGHRAVVGREDPRIVVEDLESAETLDGESDHGFGVGVAGDVGVEIGGRAARATDLFYRRLAGLIGDIGHHHRGSLAGEQRRRDLSHGRPGDRRPSHPGDPWRPPSAGLDPTAASAKGSSGHDSSIEATRGPYRLFSSHTSGLRRVGGWRPSRAAIRFSAASMPMAILVSTVALPR